jgi:hypothetical protein
LCVKALGPLGLRLLYKALKISIHLPLSSLSFALLVILKMDEHRHMVLVALVFFMAIQHVMVVVVILQQLALHQHYGAMMMMVAVMVGGSGAQRGARSVWMVDRMTNFMERQLLGSYSTYAFKQHTRLLPETFEYLCGVLTPSLIRSDSHMRLA